MAVREGPVCTERPLQSVSLTVVSYESSSSVMAPFFANQSCDPFQPRERPCELGNYVRYAVDASGPADVQKAIAFAASKNIRLVIRNTGHGESFLATSYVVVNLTKRFRLPGSLDRRWLTRYMDTPSEGDQPRASVQGTRLYWHSIQTRCRRPRFRDYGSCPGQGTRSRGRRVPDRWHCW